MALFKKTPKPRRKTLSGGEGNVTRKSLMISLTAHQHLMDMATKFDVSQPELVEALIKSADKSRLTAALSEISAAKKREAEEAEAKKSLMEKAFANLSLAELQAMLGKS